MSETAIADQLDRSARLGMELETFRRGPVYAYLVGRADEAATLAASALVEADPYAAREVQKLQNEIRRATDLRLWIEEAIEQGRVAHTALGEAEQA